jgi:predicted dehydrogenase
MVRVAIVGVGRWGPNLLRCFQASPGCQVVRVVDLEPARLEALANRVPGATLGTDAGAAFLDPRVDAVVLATPTSTHAELARRALEAGKHVLVEKPLAATHADALALASQARQAGKVLLVGHVYLYHEGARRLGALLAEGAVGQLHSLRLERTQLGPIRADADVVLDLASHDVSLVQGWLQGPPASVIATGGAWLAPGRTDEVQVSLRYPEARGALVELHASWLWPRRARRVTAVGSLGMLELDDLDLVEPLRRFRSASGSPLEAVPLSGGLPGPEPLLTEVQHFLACVRQGTPPRSGADHAAAVVGTLTAIQRSLAEGGREVLVSEDPESR